MVNFKHGDEIRKMLFSAFHEHGITKKKNLRPDANRRDRSFQVAAPRLWNSLPHIRSIQSLNDFKIKIKTLLFREAFDLG